MNDTIAAISSGSRINQPISIIRLAGPRTLDIIRKIFKGKIGSDHTITYGYIYDGQYLIDEVLVMWFLGFKEGDKIIYNNYVGEPIIEINCHGGIVVTNKILELLLSNGARMAEPGEFTRRAFLNGKLDLIKAEAIHDLIMSKTITQVKASVNRFKGKTSDLIDKFINKISLIIGMAEVNIDYPEYDDVEQFTNNKMLDVIIDLEKKLSEIIKISEDSRYIFEGVRVCILGKPNVGKSSILNALLSEEKAIVTDIAGTTRDLVEASYQINGILFKLVDTAGLRNTIEKIEKIGIKRSIEQIAKSDLIIHVVDPTQEDDEYDELIASEAKKEMKFYLKVHNKSDLIKTKNINGIYVSALNSDIKELEDALIENFKDIDIMDERIFSNTRQLSLIKNAFNSIKEAKNSLNNNQTFDVIMIDLYDAWDALQNIKGNANREDLLDVMFQNFCLGK
ncbi:tRNA uridine-5-carboxymethylaminomethyl(34) synthesis GTPase MnmE [Mycoplasmopsis cynos]|uniref:tRNA modification GTPase MnmE n=3 Tax=Mycoplasmopsis cynos TaxID=171284 RepID=L0RW26_MYCC1|nr:tRNA uridine-5-carboxymethylaminomethyl(34) synthesis GTPase MnmE [Mycoplasmopsis cynos]WAM08572.1 tRNA uridine-5-carboxymethylaminomethyl(34) synthesis GTPase MnmE [Mycoplasmopsis cynos]WQQ14544.1 tRNA uridine-5-carboxymethylaminomethyl(34) synthesis GTPase MnmE [Mycoplasmopsis cynos]WQQ16226.1 tRNA uridine-5-carboxymethylaminomethyl(34) synthesis GTPase MnmE [Mycoplasmopsis cynos]WQQ19528.1 tRNA uridine-5-carboxymethylaminomethyl(34) synthesis GTPase MnmE [Mycoplasmopsis cynos]WQQ20019.1 